MSDDDETLREVMETSAEGIPAVGSTVRDRFGTEEIYQRVVAYGDHELTAGSRELVFSGIAAGFAISITFLVYVSLYGAFDGAPVVSQLLYPLGFIYIILGGYQLYTENTLPPVTLVLERLASVTALGRVFGLVLFGNALGATIGVVILFYGGVLDGAAYDAGVLIGERALEQGWWALFFKAVFAGLIVAGVVWMDFAAGDTVSRLVLIYLAFLTIPVVGLYHVVVSVSELLFLVFHAGLDLSLLASGLLEFILPVLLGNTLGGILLVTVVNSYQVAERKVAAMRDPGAEDPLSIPEWLAGGVVGRSYVPPNREE